MSKQKNQFQLDNIFDFKQTAVRSLLQIQVPTDIQKQKPKKQKYIIRNSKFTLWTTFILFGLIFASMCIFVIYNHYRGYHQIYDLIKLNSTSALCLDGSSAAYYLSRNGDPSKILIFFSGGAWCGSNNYQDTLQKCYQRSKWNPLGTSIDLQKSVTYYNGIFSNNSGNPFKDWKRAFFLYCDGSGHQGYRKQPIKYKNNFVYFRGHNNTVEKFEDLQKRFGLYTKAQKVVISGGSAGGLATFTWANYLKQRIQKGKLWAISDAGIFYDSQNMIAKYHKQKQNFANLMKLSNSQIDPPVPQCINEFPHAKQNCMFAQNLYKHIKVPLFVFQAFYDTYSIPVILGIKCLNQGIQSCNNEEMNILQQHRRNTTKILQQICKKDGNGCWGISCVGHSSLYQSQFLDKNRVVPQYSGNTAGKSLTDWIQNNTYFNMHIDMTSWPNNRPCS